MLKGNRIILASESPRRRELLLQIGMKALVLPGRLEERPTAKQPEEAVIELPGQKAAKAADGYAATGIWKEEAGGFDAGQSGGVWDPGEIRFLYLRH